MQENMLLMKEINIQRGHNKAAKQALEAQVSALIWMYWRDPSPHQ